MARTSSYGVLGHLLSFKNVFVAAIEMMVTCLKLKKFGLNLKSLI
jgi:hypothetical protein